MKIDHHSVLNALTRSIILCDSDVEEAKEGLYVLADYLKSYFAVTARQQSPATEHDLAQLAHCQAALERFLKSGR